MKFLRSLLFAALLLPHAWAHASERAQVPASFPITAGVAIQGVAGSGSAITYTIFGTETASSVEAPKMLAQGQLPSGSPGVLYTVPAGTTTLVSSILLANTTAGDVAGVSLFVSGSAANKQITGALTIPARGQAALSTAGVIVSGPSAAVVRAQMPVGIAASSIYGTAGTGSAVSYTIIGSEQANVNELPKVLAQGQLTTSTSSALYSAPAGTSGLVSSISLVNTTGFVVSGLKLYVGGNGAANQILNALALPPNGAAFYGASSGWIVLDASGAIQTLGGGGGGGGTTYFAGVGLAVTGTTFNFAPADDLTFNGHKIISLADGSNPSDAATVGQLSAAIEGRKIKSPVDYGSTGDVALSGLGTQAGGDWTAPITDGQSVAVMQQSSNPANGVYIAHSGAWMRRSDCDSGSEITNATVLILNGATLTSKTFTQHLAVTTLGTDAQDWVLTGTATSYTAGAGLLLTGASFSIANLGVTNAMLANAANLTIKGNVSGGLGAVADLSRAQIQTNFVNPDGSTLEYASNALRVKDGGIQNAKLGNVNDLTLKGLISGGPAAPVDLTRTQVQANFVNPDGVTLGYTSNILRVLDGSIGNVKLANANDLTAKCNVSGAPAAPSDCTRTQVQTSFVNPDGSTLEYASNALRVKDGGITKAKQENVTAPVFIGRLTAGAGLKEDLTPTQATSMLNAATQSLQGAMTAADKTKLDGLTGKIQPNASGGGAVTSCRGNTIAATAETFLCGFTITANAAAVGQMYRFILLVQDTSGGTATLTPRCKAGGAGTTADTQLSITAAGPAGASNLWIQLECLVYIAATGSSATVGGHLRGYGGPTTVMGATTVAEVLANVNTAAPWFVTFSATLSAIGTTYTVRDGRGEAVP